MPNLTHFVAAFVLLECLRQITSSPPSSYTSAPQGLVGNGFLLFSVVNSDPSKLVVEMDSEECIHRASIHLYVGLPYSICMQV